MSRKNTMLVIAGSALGISGVAQAQTADLDISRAYAAELKADAAARTSQLGAAQQGGFTITDGANTLNIGALLQFRYGFNIRDDGNLTDSDDEFTHGFSLNRAQLRFSGSVINPNITYYVSGDFGAAETNSFNDGGGGGGTFNVEDAWAQYNFEGEGSGFWTRWGIFQHPVSYEETVHPEYQIAVDRSVVNEWFNGGRSEGIMIGYDAEEFRFKAAFTDGAAFPGNGEDAGSTYNSATESDFGAAVRFDYKFSGDWAQFQDFTSWQNSNNAFRVGAGFNWQQHGETNPGTTAFFGSGADEATYISWTVDAQYESNGWGLFAAYHGHDLDVDGAAAFGGANVESLNHGVVVQGNVFLAQDVELFGRYEGLFLDSDLIDSLNTIAGVSVSEENFNYLTFGVNYYLVPESHAAKVTADVVIGLDDDDTLTAVGFHPDANTTGVLGNTDSEIAFRLQIQTLF